MGLPSCFDELRTALRSEKRRSDKEWVQVLGLLVEHSLESVRQAVEASLQSGVVGLSSIKQLLRRRNQPRVAIEPLAMKEPELMQYEIPIADLGRYGALLGRKSA